MRDLEDEPDDEFSFEERESPLGPYWVIAFYRYHNNPGRMLLLGMAVALLVAYNVYAAQQQRNTAVWAIMVGIALPALAAIGLFLKAAVDWNARRHNRRIEASMRKEIDPRWASSVAATRALAAAGWTALDSTSIPRWRRHRWPVLRDAIDSLPEPRLATLVDARLAEMCARIDRPRHALEPASVRSRLGERGRAALRWSILFGVLFTAVVATCQGLANQPGQLATGWPRLIASIVLAMLLSALVGAWPALRNFTPAPLRSQFPLADLGLMRDARGRVWTVEDSFLLVEPHEHRIVATLYGPAGKLQLRYYAQGDEGFETLWQRWTHPDAGRD